MLNANDNMLMITSLFLRNVLIDNHFSHFKVKQTSFLILTDTTQSAIFTTAGEELTSRFCVQTDCSNTPIPKSLYGKPVETKTQPHIC